MRCFPHALDSAPRPRHAPGASRPAQRERARLDRRRASAPRPGEGVRVRLRVPRRRRRLGRAAPGERPVRAPGPAPGPAVQGAAAIDLAIGKSRDELHAALRETVRANGMTDGCHVRLMVSRGVKKTPSQDPRLVTSGPTIVIIAEHKQADPEVTNAGVRLATSATRRPPPDTLDPKLNCHSKLHEVVALVQAIHAGADEALMLDPHGFVATCNATNFFVVRRGEVWTSTGQYCMNGITRALVLEIARDLGLPARERDFSLTEVYDADEAFVTGTFGGLTPVIEVDGRAIGGGGVPGPVTARLSARYRELMAAEGAA